MKTFPALVIAAALTGAGLSGCSGGQDEVVDATRTAALSSVQDDVQVVAPELENLYRGSSYPQTLDEALATLPDADVELAEGNSVGGYVLDSAASEFTLCIENESGAWATYDTAPMSVREGGETGGCPDGS